MKKIIKLLSIIFIIGVVVAGAGGAASYLNSQGLTEVFAEHYSSRDITENEIVETLELDISSNEIEILPSETDKLHMNFVESEKTVFSYVLDGKKAVVKSENVISVDNFFRFHFGQKLNTKIYIPDTVKELSVKLGAGSVSVADIDNLFESVKISVASGNINLGKIKAESADISIFSGSFVSENIEADVSKFSVSSGFVNVKSGRTGNTTASVSSGSIKFDSSFVTELNCKVASGSATFSFPDKALYTVNASAASGNVILNENNSQIYNGNRILYGSGENLLKADISSGLIIFNFI